jgi:C4-dicarboxylate transporter, DctQ subunit
MMPDKPTAPMLAKCIGALDKLNGLGAVASTLVIWLLAMTVSYDVVLRAAGVPTLWASEVSIYLMIALAFLGAGTTYSVNGHFRMLAVRNLCGPKARGWLDLFSLLVTMAFAVGFTYGAWQLIEFSLMLDLKSSTILEVPMWVLQALLVLGGVLLVLATLRDLLVFMVTGPNALDHASHEVI